MPSYHMSNTGSGRSVGVRRIKKLYTDTGGAQTVARSAAAAQRDGLTTLKGLPTPAAANAVLGPLKAPPPKTPGGTAPGGTAPGGTGPGAGPGPQSKPGIDREDKS